jgi:hypothetical protein
MRTHRFFHSALVILVLGLFASCGSDDPAAPPTDDDDGQNTPGFTITNPVVGNVYVWGGNGYAGAGAMGKAPGFTSLYWPIDIGFDAAEGPVLLDWNNHRVLALDAAGNFKKIVGNAFGQPVDGPAAQARLNHPTHVTFSPAGDKMILSAWHNSVVTEVDVTTQMLRRFCGTGGRCYNTVTDPLLTCLDLPVCALFHPVTGELYISDQGNQIIRKIDSSGEVHLVAGTAPVGSPGAWSYQFGYYGDGGQATSALLHFERGQLADPSGKFCFDADGNMYIADTNNHAIRIVYASDGTIATFAGTGPSAGGYDGDGGLATAAKLNKPRDVVADADGNVFIADAGNSVIRMVDTSGMISTVVGIYRAPIYPNPNPDPIPAAELHNEHGVPALQVHLTSPRGVEIDADGNLWIADTLNNVVRIYYR